MKRIKKVPFRQHEARFIDKQDSKHLTGLTNFGLIMKKLPHNHTSVLQNTVLFGYDTSGWGSLDGNLPLGYNDY